MSSSGGNLYNDANGELYCGTENLYGDSDNRRYSNSGNKPYYGTGGNLYDV